MASPAVDLRKAYETVFQTSYGHMVLCDLLAVSGFLSAYPAGAAPDVLIDHNAQRRMFGRVFEMLMASQVGREAIAEAMASAQPEKEDT